VTNICGCPPNSRETIYVAEANLVEIPFIQRELGYCVKLVNPRQFSTTHEVVRIAGTNPEIWLDYLKAEQESEIKFILLGNETFSQREYEYLFKFGINIQTIVFNPPRQSNSLGLNAISAEIIQKPNIILDPMFYRTAKNAFDFSRRTKKLHRKKIFTSFPQGYSKRFLEELALKGMLSKDPHSSLLDSDRIKSLTGLARSGFFFVGQEGSWYRGQLIARFENYPSFYLKQTGGWGGDGQGKKLDYLENLLSRKGVLCPPGNLINSTCRYWEGILTGCLPIIPPYTIQDHHSESVWTDQLPITKRFNYSKIVDHVLSLDELERAQIIEQEAYRFRRTLNELMLILD
jgi:hypothetical protein